MHLHSYLVNGDVPSEAAISKSNPSLLHVLGHDTQFYAPKMEIFCFFFAQGSMHFILMSGKKKFCRTIIKKKRKYAMGRSILNLTQFEAAIWAKHNTLWQLLMEGMESFKFGLKDANVKILKKTIKNVIKSNKCNQCDYASSHTGNLRTHLKTHSGEKSNKCDQCDFASSLAGSLRRHLKTHGGEKSNKCNLCDFVSSQAINLRTHLKTHSGETLHPLVQAI